MKLIPATQIKKADYLCKYDIGSWIAGKAASARVFTSCVTERRNGGLRFNRINPVCAEFTAFVWRFKRRTAVLNAEISTNIAGEARRLISTSATASPRPAQAPRAAERVSRGKASPDARCGRGEGPRVRRVRGGGPGGSFERIRGRGKTRLRDRAPLLQRQQDVSRSTLTHDLSDVTAHWPRPARKTYCTRIWH